MLIQLRFRYLRKVAMFRHFVFFLLFAFLVRGCSCRFRRGPIRIRQKDYALALKEWKQLPTRATPARKTAWAILYALGQGVAADQVLAAQWYLKAAKQGAQLGQYNVGRLTNPGRASGKTMPRHCAGIASGRARVCQGSNRVANMYAHGIGAGQDYALALTWYRKAESQGLADAQVGLAFMYVMGNGVDQDYVTAVACIARPPNQEQAFAENMLGYMYAEGLGVPQDYARALEWRRKAADQDLPEAQFDLGVMYEKGQGVKLDYVKR